MRKKINLKQFNRGLGEGIYARCDKCNTFVFRKISKSKRVFVCCKCQSNQKIVGKYRRKFSINLDFNKMYNTYNVEQWVDFLIDNKIKCIPYEIYNDKDKMLLGLKYYIEKYLKLDTRDKVLSIINKTNYNGNTLLENYAYKNYKSIHDCVIDIFSNYDIKHWEFKFVTAHFFKDKNNVREYLTWFIEVVLKSNINNSIEYSKYFTDNNLCALGFSRIVHIKKHFKYPNYFFMLKDLIDNNISDIGFNICKAKDGTLLDSNEEVILYEYIKHNISKNIKAIGKSRKNMYENNGEKYAPDFELSCIDKDKKIIIEYFGLYYENTYNNKILEEYKNKANRKIEYFSKLDNIMFVALYPNDLKNNFKGVSEKLASFIM